MLYSQDLEKDIVKVERQQQRYSTNNGDELAYCVFLLQEDTKHRKLGIHFSCIAMQLVKYSGVIQSLIIGNDMKWHMWYIFEIVRNRSLIA
jgi:hypothetical protein